jgi:hypothetical protein
VHSDSAESSAKEITSAGASKRRLSRLSAALLWSILALWFVNVFGAFTPTMPRPSVDSSWEYALNQAVAQGLTFGKEIIFTFGPYAAVYTRVYHPATVTRMIAGNLLLDTLFVACFVWLVRDARWRWPLTLFAILTVVVMSQNLVQDAFLLSVPILPNLVLLKLRRRYGTEAFSKNSTQILIVLAFACLGLLPLIKGTLIGNAAGNCVLGAMFLAVNRRRLLAILCVAAPVLTMVALWYTSGQPLLALPSFFLSMSYIVSGYSEAMATNGSHWDLLIALAASWVVLGSIVLNKGLPRDQRIFLLLIFLGFLFIGFKEGFVRQDPGHVVVFMNCLAICILFLSLLQDATLSFVHLQWLGFALLIPAAISSCQSWRADFINAMKAAELPTERERNLPIRGRLNSLRRELGTHRFLSIALSTQPFPILPWNFNLASWPTQFQHAKQEIDEKSDLDFAMPGTVDIYTADLSSLLAHGYHWDPRPILQSYTSYTPELLRLNEQHLRSAEAPDHLVFRLDTIDNWLPSLDDGLSWPAMLDNYEVAGAAHNWIHLTRKSDASRKAVSRYTSVQTVSTKLGEAVRVPAFSGFTFAAVYARPSALGKLIGVAYKIPSLTMRVTMRSGAQADFRVNANMMKTGFLLSPLVTTTQDFQHLFQPEGSFLEQNRVASVALVVSGSRKFCWKDEYTVTFEQYQF